MSDNFANSLGINVLSQFLYNKGGPAQQDRMIKDKRRTLDRAVLYSYQGALVKKVDSNDEYSRALINPNKLKQDYDDKVISSGFENGFEPGDIIEWKNTGTYWIIYLQDLTELAYFRADIRKCCYGIKWKDEDGNIQFTYAAIRGPVETKINSIQKNETSLDVPNHSLNFLIPKNQDTLKYFNRYSKFFLWGIADGDQPVCWRVEGKDSISMPGIINITAVEYYANKEDDDIDNGVVDGLIPEKIDPNFKTKDISAIEGDTFIKPLSVQTYKYLGSDIPKWSFDKKLPIEYSINEDGSFSFKWMKTVSGQFELICNDSSKTIVIESLF